MADTRPLGVFDSGMGGLSVLREIRALLPGEDLLYCADSGYAPYGEKPQVLIRARSLELGAFLIGQGAKALVVACNTATAAAAQALRQVWPDLPVIAMEPAVKPAATATRSGVVGVLATTGTLESAQFAALLDNFGNGVRVVTRPGVGLVEAVEQGAADTPALRALLDAHLTPLLDAGADVIVLGCTHYVFLRRLVEERVGTGVKVIDTGAAVARQVGRRLAQVNALCARARPGRERFWCSDDPARAQRVISLLWRPVTEVLALPPSVCMAQSAQAR